MSKLLVTESSEQQDKFEKPAITTQQDIKLLSFTLDFSKKLRESGFTITKVETEIVKEPTVLSQSFALIEHNIYKSNFADGKMNEDRMIKPKTFDECSNIRSVLIEALRLGLDTIWPVLREIDLKDLQTIQAVDEVDCMSVTPGLIESELELKTQRINVVSKSVVPERTTSLMGPSPVLDATFVDEDGVAVEIISSTRPNRVKKENSEYRPLTKDKTLRFSKRANLIINSVRQERIVTFFRLKQIVVKSEAEEGCDFQVDKRSLLTVIRVLIQEGFLKAYKIIIARKPSLQEQCFICSLDVQADDEQLKRSIDCLKAKLLLPATKEVKPMKVSLTFVIVNS